MRRTGRTRLDNRPCTKRNSFERLHKAYSRQAPQGTFCIQNATGDARTNEAAVTPAFETAGHVLVQVACYPCGERSVGTP